MSAVSQGGGSLQPRVVACGARARVVGRGASLIVREGVAAAIMEVSERIGTPDLVAQLRKYKQMSAAARRCPSTVEEDPLLNAVEQLIGCVFVAALQLVAGMDAVPPPACQHI